jgi:hypothetical protein
MKKDFECQGGVWPQNMGCDIGDDGRCVSGLANLPVEQSDFGLFHLLRGALSADFRQSSPARHKLASLILRILKALCLLVPFRVLVPTCAL